MYLSQTEGEKMAQQHSHPFHGMGGAQIATQTLMVFSLSQTLWTQHMIQPDLENRPDFHLHIIQSPTLNL